MSLVNCPECGRENVSDSAIACPICGYNVKEHYDNLKKQEEHKSQERLKLEELEKQKRLRQLAIQEQVERKQAKRQERKEQFNRIIKKAKPLIIVLTISAILIVIICAMNSNYAIYQKGIKKYNNAEYENAICEFQKIFDYKDSAILIDKCQYEIANQCFLDGKIEKSEKILYSIQSLDTTSLQQKIDYSKCLSYIEAKEYMKAYKGLLGINENYILNYNSYQKGDLENLIVTCKSGIAGQGKEYYDKADYLNAYQYFVISFIQNNISYLTEYQACRLINAIQGELYSNSSSNYYSEDTILVNGTTITISSDNRNVKKGTYTTTLQKKINQWDGLEKWALVFDDINAYIELPRNNNLSVYLYSNNSNFSDIYYPKETIEKFRENKLASQPKEPSIGMTHKQVEASTWGKPTKINKTTYSWGTTEQWCYPDYKYIYFDDGYVTAISE